MKPLAIELFAGLHGWGEGLVSEGFTVVGFDIVDMCRELGQQRPEGCGLVLQDVLTLDGYQFRNASVIVASPPCQNYSYMAMPWKRAKQIALGIKNKSRATGMRAPDFPEGYEGPRNSMQLNALFDACFRIQREANTCPDCHGINRFKCRMCKGVERPYIPMVVENVKGAQPWVGRAAWHYGSFYLWGDVPALMPFSRRQAKVPGLNWSGSDKPGYVARAFNDTAVAQLRDETKQGCSSKSPARKAASAQIAKIPFQLASHIARVYKPSGI